MTEKLSSAEIAEGRAKAARGEVLSLDFLRRVILTMRRSFTASPVAVEKSKKTRNSKPVVTEDQIDFF